MSNKNLADSKIEKDVMKPYRLTMILLGSFQQVAPREHFIATLNNHNLDHQRFKVLFISGNFSRVESIMSDAEVTSNFTEKESHKWAQLS